MKTRIALTLLTLSMTPGCLPIPHDVTIHPDLQGSVTIQGVPAAHHELRYAHGAECAEEVAGMTDATGRYAIPARIQHEEYIFFGDTLYPSRLCVRLPQGDGVWRFPTESTDQSIRCNATECFDVP